MSIQIDLFEFKLRFHIYFFYSVAAFWGVRWITATTSRREPAIRLRWPKREKSQKEFETSSYTIIFKRIWIVIYLQYFWKRFILRKCPCNITARASLLCLWINRQRDVFIVGPSEFRVQMPILSFETFCFKSLEEADSVLIAYWMNTNHCLNWRSHDSLKILNSKMKQTNIKCFCFFYFGPGQLTRLYFILSFTAGSYKSYKWLPQSSFAGL